MIVGQALDDLEAERIDLSTALRLVAVSAWREGHIEGERYCPGCAPPARPDP